MLKLTCESYECVNALDRKSDFQLELLRNSRSKVSYLPRCCLVRQSNRERRANALFAFDADGAAVKVDKVANEV